MNKYNKVKFKVEYIDGKVFELNEDVNWDACAEVYAAIFRKFLIGLTFDPEIAKGFVLLNKAEREEFDIEDGDFSGLF